MAPSALDRIIRELVDSEGESSEDFDRRVADLIVAEAREKNKGHSQSKSSLDQSSRRHTTNTRFLNNVVRGVQSHNRAVLASSSAEAERPGRASELRMPARSSVRDDEERRGSRMRGWSDDDEDRRASTSRQETPSESSRKRSLRHHNSNREDRDRRHRKHSTREKEGGDERHERRRSQSPRRRKSRTETHTTKSEIEAGPSKMDRYFDEKYDPMLDVRAETRTDENGLIEDDGWERMLQAVKDKEERKRARKEGKVHRHKEDQAPRVGADVMQTQYTSRGKLREWDKGKDDSAD